MKTSSTPWMKRITMYICFIIALCFFNLVAIKAQDPVNQTNSVNTQPAPAAPKVMVVVYTAFENVNQKATQYMNTLSTLLKNMKEMSQSVTRNTN